MTSPLTSHEFELIGKPKEWGVLPVRPMGATIRLTKDKRILIRNTAEVRTPFRMSQLELNKRIQKHKIGIKKRFPQLPDNIIQSIQYSLLESQVNKNVSSHANHRRENSKPT